MQCKQVHDHLSAYLDRELTAELASAVRHHLASCPECRAMLEDLRATADLLGRLPVREAPAGMADDVRREIERRMLAPQAADEAAMPERTLAAHTVRLWPRVLAVAACVALAAGIGLVAYFGEEALDEPMATGPELVRHDAAEMSTEYAAAPGTESAAAGRSRKRTAVGGERVDKTPAKAPAYGAGTGGRLAGPAKGLDIRLRTKDASTALHDVPTDPHVVDLDAYAPTNGLDPGALAINLAEAPDDKASFWCMQHRGDERQGSYYYDFDGSRHVAGQPVNVPILDGIGSTTFEVPDAGEPYLAFVDSVPEAGAAPAEVLFGKGLGDGEESDADATRQAVFTDDFARTSNAAWRDRRGLDMAGAVTATVPADAPIEALTDAETDAAAEADSLAVAGGTDVDVPPGKGGVDETAALDDGLMAKAAPAMGAETRGSAAAKAPAAVPAQPAGPQLVQMTMNYVAVGQAPLGSLGDVANKDNLSVASNQLVVDAPSRERANRDLVRLFTRNGWRELDEKTGRDRARKKSEAKSPARPEVTGGMPGRGTARGAPEGLYYRAARNGEDLWVVVTTPDDLTRFASQVAGLRTVEVARESTQPFQAVRYLQRELAQFEAESVAGVAAGEWMGGERAGGRPRAPRFGATNGAVPEGSAEAGPKAEEVAGQRIPGIARSQVETDRTGNGRMWESESAQQAQAHGEALQQKAKGAGEELAKRPALQPRPAEPVPAKAPKPEALEEEEKRLARAHVAEELESAPRPAMGKKAEEPAAEKQAGEAAPSEAKPAQDGPDAAAPQPRTIARQQPAAAEQRFWLQIIPPNQVMLVVRVRSADDPPRAAAEAARQEAETAEPAATQQRVEPAVRE